MLIKDNFYVTFNNNYNKIKIILDLYRVYRHGSGVFNLELINENFINISYLDKNNISLKIDTNESAISTNLDQINTNTGNISTNLDQINTNKNNISTNLINIRGNEDNIAYNLSEINNIKNNKSTQYLKNIYNILFYDKKTQIDFRNLFYEKAFDVNSEQNDFTEMYFKIDLQYEDISERNYVKIIYQLFDQNDNSLCIKSVTNNDYKYFSNRVIVDENIFYNFNKNIKKIKFVIKFQMILSRVIKIWYINNNNYRFILKHYST